MIEINLVNSLVTGKIGSPEAGLKDCSCSLVREREEWGEVATEDMAETADTDMDSEEAGDWMLLLMDMGAITPHPGYMQPHQLTSQLSQLSHKLSYKLSQLSYSLTGSPPLHQRLDVAQSQEDNIVIFTKSGVGDLDLVKWMV